MRNWSETEFQKRVDARVLQLNARTGKTEHGLLIEAGLKGDEIRKEAKRARRMDTLAGIARALQWTMGQAIGIQDPTLFLEREREIDPTKLARALRMAEEAIGDNPEGDRLATVANVASLVYSTLSEREAAGKSVDDEEARELLRSMLRHFFTK